MPGPASVIPQIVLVPAAKFLRASRTVLSAWKKPAPPRAVAPVADAEEKPAPARRIAPGTQSSNGGYPIV
jgi:hypothetical protein